MSPGINRRPRYTLRIASPCSRLLRDRLPLFLVKVPFFAHPSEKTTLIFAFWQGFREKDGIKYVTKIQIDLKGFTSQ
jgi:hypothetical protein